MTDKKLLQELGELILNHLVKREIRLIQGMRVLRSLNLTLKFEAKP